MSSSTAARQVDMSGDDHTARFQAVVRVFATTQSPNYDSPWQASAPTSSSGSGVVVGNGLILTGAHVVADATFLQVQRLDRPDKGVAVIKSICHDADLALLQTEDLQFCAGIEPASIGELPTLSDEVQVVGFPVGGEEVSITEGVVSRIEVQKYTHSRRRLLAVTVDAAINSGNSGGPVFLKKKVVGIAFQSLGDAENIGELVPAPLLSSFLEQAQERQQVRIPSLGLSIQHLENPLLRSHVKMRAEQSGVLVRRIAYGGSADGIIFPGDVLLSLDGYTIANNGTVRFRGRHRTDFAVVLGLHRIGEVLPVEVLRGGRVLNLKVELKAPALLVPRNEWGEAPRFLVFGGLVFQPLTQKFLETWERWWETSPSELQSKYYSGIRSKEMHEVVVLARVLADHLTVGFDSHEHDIITHYFDEPIQSLAWLCERIDAATDIIELRTSLGSKLVLEPKAVRARQQEILARYQIPKARSADLPVPQT